jgi:molybdopterin molybdotransferase
MNTIKPCRTDSIELSVAMAILDENACSLPYETIPLAELLLRVPARPCTALLPQPGYDQSMRDGFVLSAGGEKIRDGMRFRIFGEAPAGGIQKIVLEPGMSCRIMTGGMVPVGGIRIVPQEDCAVEGGVLVVPDHALLRKNTFIQGKGDQIAEGDLLAAAGTILQPEHIALLSAAGHDEITVFGKPRVGFFCTGSELVESADQLVPGLKMSTNLHLIGGLARQFMAESESLGIARDTREDLDLTFARLKSTNDDVLISTGGMGPGKYDLLEEAFCRAGGEVLFHSLEMRPGRSTLFGRIGSTLFFGLPGPPEAVRALMNELVGPALLRLQGVKDCDPVTIIARLEKRVEVRNHDVLHLKPGILTIKDGYANVRPADRMEIATCFILLSPGRGTYEAGSEVLIHLVYSPFASRIFATS